MDVLFINDSTSNRNWGDRAAATSMRTMLTTVGGHVVHSITERQLLDTDFDGSIKAATKRLPGAGNTFQEFVPPIALRLGRRLARRINRHKGPALIPRVWADYERSALAVLGPSGPWPGLIRAVAQSDAVVVHGDGCMVGNGIMPRTVLFLAYLFRKHLDTPVAIVNHTADFDHPALAEAAKHVYPLLDDVVFRDPVSAERCESFCNGRFAPDAAFTFEPIERTVWHPVCNRATYFDVWPDTARFDPTHPYVCVGGSSSFGGGADVHALSVQFASLVRHVRSIYPGQVVLTVSDLVDEAVFRPVAKALDAPLVAVSTPVQQAVDILGNADAYIGGRWHPSIFSARGGTPFIPLSAKTFKMQALAATAGLPATTFDAARVASEKEGIGHRLLEVLDEGPALRSRLRAWAATQADGSWGNVDYVRRAAGSAL